MAAVSVWGISAVRPGAPGSRLSSPPVSSRVSTPDRPRLSSPRLSRSGARFAASRGRRTAAGPAAACAASRCSAPGLWLGRRGRPLAPGPRPASPAPRPARRLPNALAVRSPAPAGGVGGWAGGERPRPRSLRLGCAGEPALPRGAPTSPAPPAPGRSPPRPAPPARAPGFSLRFRPSVQRSERG